MTSGSVVCFSKVRVPFFANFNLICCCCRQWTLSWRGRQCLCFLGPPAGHWRPEVSTSCAAIWFALLQQRPTPTTTRQSNVVVRGLGRHHLVLARPFQAPRSSFPWLSIETLLLKCKPPKVVQIYSNVFCGLTSVVIVCRCCVFVCVIICLCCHLMSNVSKSSLVPVSRCCGHHQCCQFPRELAPAVVLAHHLALL